MYALLLATLASPSLNVSSRLTIGTTSVGGSVVGGSPPFALATPLKGFLFMVLDCDSP